MPKVFDFKGFRFFFFSGDCFEPIHIHVEKDNSVCKVWLKNCEISENIGFTKKELKFIKEVIETNKKIIKDKWNAFCPKK